MGNYSGLSRWAQCNHKGSYKMEVDGQKAERWCEDGNRGNERQCDVGPQAKGWGQLLEAGKDKELDIPWILQKENSPVNSLILDFWPPEL